MLSELNDPASFRSQVFYPYLNLIKVRRNQKAFHPNANFEILEMDPRIFAIKRYSEKQTIVALTNISAAEVPLSMSNEDIPDRMTDLISGENIHPDSFTLRPYQYVWLTTEDS